MKLHRLFQYQLLSSVLVLMSCTCSADAASLDKGIQLAKQGKYSDAVTELRQAPQSSTNYYYQGYCYYQLHQVNGAKKLFAFVVSSYPHSSEARLATDFLKRIDPTSVAAGAPATTAAAHVPTAASSGISASSSNSGAVAENEQSTQLQELIRKIKGLSGPPPDMSKLPDESRIYFTPAASSGHMIVDAMINGHPMKCMFDTGAPGLLFGKNHLRNMGIPVPTGPPTSAVSGWAGVALPAWDMKLSVKVGSVERILNAKIQEELDLSPLIGYSFIQGYQYEIDQKAKVMTLRKESQGATQAINSLYDIPCTIVHTKPVVALEVNGKKIPVFIDTGAAVSIINADDASSFRLEIPSDAPVLYASGIGGAAAYRGVNLDLRLGPIVRKEFQVMVGGHAGNAVGQDFLQGWRFTVDEKKGFLRFFH